ncbi:acetyltransferase [Pseudomaricurvus hydrocarbonicus]|uniref:acetyltransferase n=1 Tax=Pseudomaricurvus hydrocarbonicus TaxID=1470433 RepID=UPI001AA0272E|nr:acetyltransferase [Aestuariicella hydrocarbonica]
MLMKLQNTGALVELSAPEGLWDPYVTEVMGCRLAGEEMQEQEAFKKSELAFLSGEHLPRCWLNVHYRDQEWETYKSDPLAAAAVAGPTSYYGA